MILQVMSKLFFRILFQRITNKLEKQFTPEEMGFRKKFSCSDLIYLILLTGEKSIEWGETVWMASLDLEKSFDKIVHEAVFEGLELSGVDHASIAAIKSLYADQKAYIDFGTETNKDIFKNSEGSTSR